MPFFAASEAPPRSESMKFPVNSLLAGNLAFSETSSQLTPPSSGESTANLISRAHRGAVARSGTESSNPSPSSGESAANPTKRLPPLLAVWHAVRDQVGMLDRQMLPEPGWRFEELFLEYQGPRRARRPSCGQAAGNPTRRTRAARLRRSSSIPRVSAGGRMRLSRPRPLVQPYPTRIEGGTPVSNT